MKERGRIREKPNNHLLDFPSNHLKKGECSKLTRLERVWKNEILLSCRRFLNFPWRLTDLTRINGIPLFLRRDPVALTSKLRRNSRNAIFNDGATVIAMRRANATLSLKRLLLTRGDHCADAERERERGSRTGVMEERRKTEEERAAKSVPQHCVSVFAVFTRVEFAAAISLATLLRAIRIPILFIAPKIPPRSGPAVVILSRAARRVCLTFLFAYSTL